MSPHLEPMSLPGGACHLLCATLARGGESASEDVLVALCLLSCGGRAHPGSQAVSALGCWPVLAAPSPGSGCSEVPAILPSHTCLPMAAF